MFKRAILAVALVAAPAFANPPLARMSVDEGTFGWHLSQLLYAHQMCRISTADLGNAAAYYDNWASTHAKYATPQKVAWAKDNAMMWAMMRMQPGQADKLCARMRSQRSVLIASAKRDVEKLQEAHRAARTEGH